MGTTNNNLSTLSISGGEHSVNNLITISTHSTNSITKNRQLSNNNNNNQSLINDNKTEFNNQNIINKQNSINNFQIENNLRTINACQNNISNCQKLSLKSQNFEDILNSQYFALQKNGTHLNNFRNLTNQNLSLQSIAYQNRSETNHTNSIQSFNGQNLFTKDWNYQQRLSYNQDQNAAGDSQNYSAALLNTPMTAAAAAAAAAAAVSKFEQATNGSTMSTNGSFTSTNWSNVISATADWDLVARSGLDSRIINTPSYYNATNYAAATNAAYLASYPQNYMRNSTAVAAVAAAANTPLNYLAATTCNGMNYGYGSGNYGFAEYYNNLNYYNTQSNSAAALISASPSTTGGDLISSRSSSSVNNNSSTNDDYKNGQLKLNYNNNDENQCNLLLHDISSSSIIPSLSLHSNSSSISPHGISKVIRSKVEKPKRSKKKKTGNNNNGNSICVNSSNGVIRTTPEPNESVVYVWELEDLCNLALNHQYRPSDEFAINVIRQIVQRVFHGDELNQANVEDTEIDEALQNQDLYSNLSQNQNINHSLDPINCATTTSSTNCSQQSIDFLTGYPTIVNPSTSTAMCNSNIISTVPTPSIVNHEVLEGLKRVAEKYKRIRATYDAYKNDYSAFLNISELSAQREHIHARLRNNYQTKLYRNCLKLIMERSQLIKKKSTNFVLTRESLPNAFAKLLSFDLALFVPIENVFSISKLGYESGLAHITERFRKSNVVIISSNHEFKTLARQEMIPFWPLNDLNDINKFYMALDGIILSISTTPTSTEPCNSLSDVMSNNSQHTSIV